MGDLGFGEIILIVIIAILLYGKDLPQVARKFARYYHKFRRHLDDIKSEISRQIPAEDISLDSPSPAGYYGDSPPPPPTGLTATLEGNQVFLSWDYDAQAEYYNVKRSTPPEGSYAMIASGITSTTYTDYPPMEGPSVSYVVSAANGAGEGGDSVEVMIQFPIPSSSPVAGSSPTAPVPEPQPVPPPAAGARPADGHPPEAAPTTSPPAADPDVPPMS